MELLRRMEPFSLLVMFLGALDLGIIGLFNTNILAEVFGGGDWLAASYTVIGVAALTWVPRLMEVMHIDMPDPRTHRA